MARSHRVTPGPGQESVWDYPRPPRLERGTRRVRIQLGGSVILDTTDSWRVLETSHPPTVYVPRSAFTGCELRPAGQRTRCEWKGTASYVDLVGGDVVAPAVAWGYPEPTPAFAPLAAYLTVYPEGVDGVWLDDEPVRPQPGGFYGGWVTEDVVGPFKGEPGTMFW